MPRAWPRSVREVETLAARSRPAAEPAAQRDEAEPAARARDAGGRPRAPRTAPRCRHTRALRLPVLGDALTHSRSARGSQGLALGSRSQPSPGASCAARSHRDVVSLQTFSPLRVGEGSRAKSQTAPGPCHRRTRPGHQASAECGWGS